MSFLDVSKILQSVNQGLRTHAVLFAQGAQKIVVQQINILFFSQVRFEKFPRHQQRGREKIRLSFRYVRPLARYVVSQAHAEFAIHTQLLLIVQKKMAELVRHREILTPCRMAGVNPNDGLIAIAIKEAGHLAFQRVNVDACSFCLGDFGYRNRRRGDPRL
jgi:hypothetical protein